MKNILLFLLLLVFASCKGETKIPDFQFLSTNSKTIYTLSSFQDTIEHEYNSKFKEILFVLIETPSLVNEKYIKQIKLFEILPPNGADDSRLIYITACLTEEYSDGYHTTLGTAKMLSKNNNSFRITVFNATGTIFKRSKVPLSIDKIII